MLRLRQRWLLVSYMVTIVGTLVSLTSAFAQFTPCHTIKSTDPIPTGFASPYNIISSEQELIFKGFCDLERSEVEIEVGNGDKYQYVYNQGHYWEDNVRHQFSLTCDGREINNTWCVRSARHTLSLNDLSRINWVVAYVCTWTGSEWKCGCRDRACTQQFWNVQGFQQSPKSILFTGVFGGGFENVVGSENISTWANSEIVDFMSDEGLDCNSCDPRNIEDLRIIAKHNIGGLTALAFYVHGIGGINSSINTPGNADILRANIEMLYRDHPNVRIFLAGHSAGGGDVQDLLGKLKILDIPVEMSGHIDSIEIGDDASIPSNTNRAMGFYQKDDSFIGEITEGEDNLFAEDPTITIVSNTKIDEPQGPANPGISDQNAYHRNMDNDERVWGVILNYIKNFSD